MLFRRHPTRSWLALALAGVLAVYPLTTSSAVQPASQPAPDFRARRASERREGPSSQPATLDRKIRVLILDGLAACQVVIEEPFQIINAESGAKLLDSPATAQLTIRFERGQILLPELSGMFTTRAIDLVPTGTKPLLVGMPKGTRRFRGRLRALRTGPASGSLVNVVDIEDYLVGVVTAEMPASFHPEALRVQAIAARTYAWYGKLTAGSRGWDVASTEASQVYLGMDRESAAPEAVKAVRATAGLVCTWSAPEGERVFCTYYSSTCGGSTQPSSAVKNESAIPPLSGVTCGYCTKSPAYRWGPVRMEKETLTRRLRDRYAAMRQIGPVDIVEVIERTGEGRPTRLSIRDADGREVQLEAENFRLAADPTGREIRSTFFTLVLEPDALTFQDGRGFGHGLGLCQYGAQGMALAGKLAPEILSFYYPSSHITRAY